MSRARYMLLFGTGGMVAASLAVITVQHGLISQLRVETKAQQEQLAQSSEVENPISAQTPTDSESESTQKPKELERELLRLRNEVRELRAKQTELAQVQSDNARLKSLLQASEQARSSRQPQSFQFGPDDVRPSVWIGVVIAAQNDGGDSNTGTGRIVVNSVAENSPAAEAQIEAGDVLLQVDGETVTNLSQFRERVAQSKFGQPLLLDVMRDDVTRQVTVIPKPPPK